MKNIVRNHRLDDFGSTRRFTMQKSHRHAQKIGNGLEFHNGEVAVEKKNTNHQDVYAPLLEVYISCQIKTKIVSRTPTLANLVKTK
jgi:hypothetical protein